MEVNEKETWNQKDVLSDVDNKNEIVSPIESSFEVARFTIELFCAFRASKLQKNQK